MIDPNIIQDLVIKSMIAVPIITGLVQVIKLSFPKIITRFIPAISLGLGIVSGILFVGISITGIVVGVILGLSANGLWEVGSKTIANN